MSNFYIGRKGKKSGPFTRAQLKQMAASGMLDPDDLIAQEGGKQWTKASMVRGLLPEAAPIPTAIPAGPAPEETDMPWLSGTGADMPRQSSGSTSTSYKRNALAHKPAKNQALPFIIGGAVAVVVLLLGGVAFVVYSVNSVSGGKGGGIPGLATRHSGDTEPTVEHIKGVFAAGTVVDKKGFFEHYGRPDQTTDFNGETIFVYNCADGGLRMRTVLYPSTPKHPDGTFVVLSVEQNY